MNRKTFLASSGLLVLASCLPKNILTQPKKKLGLQLYTIRHLIEKNVEESLYNVAQLGFQNVEIYGYNKKFFGKTVTEFAEILKKNKLHVLSSHHSLSDFKNPEFFEKACQDLQSLGCQYMVLAYLQQEERTEKSYQELPKILEKSATIALKYGIQVGYHNHDFEFKDRVENQSAYDYLLSKTSKNIVFEMDLYWMYRAEKKPIDYFKKYPKRFPLWHVKDRDSKDQSFSEIGNGNIPFQTIFEHRDLAGLKHWFVEQDESKKPILESLKQSVDYVNQHSFFK